MKLKAIALLTPISNANRQLIASGINIKDLSKMSDNIFSVALNALTNNGCPEGLAQSAAFIVANDDPFQPDLGRTPEQQQIIQEALPYLQSGGIYDQFETIDSTPNPLTHGQFLGNFGGELPTKLFGDLPKEMRQHFLILLMVGLNSRLVTSLTDLRS